MLRSRSLLLVGLVLLAPTWAAARPTAFDDPAQAGPELAVQGEYVGQVKTNDGETTYGVQVVALGEGNYRVVAYRGGLPGDGWDKSDPMAIDAATTNATVSFEVPQAEVKASIVDGKIIVTSLYGQSLGTLERVVRKSPTLGTKPPAGAVVLFDGTTADKFVDGRMTDDGLLKEGAVSKDTFGSATIHLEFRTPFTPDGRGQGRGNSGCYVQGRYEVQILDSFGLEAKDNECGGIYQVAAPAVNMAFPPLTWQTFDIDFTAAQYDGSKKVANARITVRHNGVVIHDDVELPQETPGGVMIDVPEPGPLMLQNHRDPVRFRNIWVVPKP